MAINFPSSPTNGQLYTEGGITWVFVSAKSVWQVTLAGTLLAHIHPQSDITNLIADLAAKAELSHTHTAANITDSTAAGRAMLLAANAAAQTALLNAFSSTLKGLVPLSGGGTTNFLRADGTFAAPASGSSLTENAQVGTTYTLALTDAGKIVTLTNAAEIILTIPTNAVIAFPVGTVIDLGQGGLGKVKIGGAGVTIKSLDGELHLIKRYSHAKLWKEATDTWWLIGDISTIIAVSTYIGSTMINSANVTTETFTNHAIGVAAADRYVVVGITWRLATLITSVTIGGVAATIHQQHSAGAQGSAIVSALVPSGTTATIVVNFNTGAYRVSAHVWNLNSVNSITPIDTLTATGVDPTGTIDVNAGGVIFACSSHDSGTGGTTWTGVTEKFDSINNGEVTTAGSLDYVAAVVSQTIKADFVGVSSNTSLTAVSFR